MSLSRTSIWTDSVHVRIASHDAATRTSNTRFNVTIDTWPVRAGNGLRGISLIAANFPNNVANIRTGVNDELRITTSEETATVTITPFMSTRYRYKKDGDGTFSDWIELLSTDGVGTVGTYYNNFSLTSSVITQVRNHFQSLTGYAAADLYYPILDSGPSELYGFKLDYPVNNYIFEVDSRPANSVPRAAAFVDSDGGGIVTLNDVRQRFNPFAKVLTIPEGFYTDTQLAEAINGQINAVFTSPAGYSCQVSETVPASVEDGKFVFTVAASETLTVYGTTFGSSIGGVFGLDGYIGGALNVTIPEFPNLHGPGSLYVHSSILAQKNTVDGDGAHISVVKSIPLDVPHRGQVSWQNDSFTPDVVFRASPVYKTINITLRDSFGNNVDIGTGELELFFRVFV